MDLFSREPVAQPLAAREQVLLPDVLVEAGCTQTRGKPLRDCLLYTSPSPRD